MHGYEMIQELDERTGGAWKPSPGSVYPTLTMLEEEGLVTAVEADGKRRFTLTEAGTEAVAERPGPSPWEQVVSDASPAVFELREVLGPDAEIEVMHSLPAVETDATTPLYGHLEAMLRKHDPLGEPLPYMVVGFTDAVLVAPLEDVDAIAVTAGPGLVGALVVGVAAAKSLALALDKPLYGVNHLSAHVAVDQLQHGTLPEGCVALLASGGHSSILRVADVTADVPSDLNLLPVSNRLTSWSEPVRRIWDDPVPLDAIVIDNLPSLLPQQASQDFSSGLVPILPGLFTGDPVWGRAAATFHGAITGLELTAEV